MAAWLSIKVELVEGHGTDFWPRPGRVFAAAPNHTFEQLADAINDGFARWDRNHLWAFDLADGSRVSTPNDWLEEDEEEPLDPETPLSKLELGERFSFEFDFGDGWGHLCTVGPELINPLETLGIRPHSPLPYWGWGELPDQYQRRWSDDDGESSPPPNSNGEDLPSVGSWRWLPHNAPAPPAPPAPIRPAPIRPLAAAGSGDDDNNKPAPARTRHLTVIEGGGEDSKSNSVNADKDLGALSMRTLFDIFQRVQLREKAPSTAAKTADILIEFAEVIDSLEPQVIAQRVALRSGGSLAPAIAHARESGDDAMDVCEASELKPLVELFYAELSSMDFNSRNFINQLGTEIRKLTKWVELHQIIDSETRDSIIAFTKTAGDDLLRAVTP